MLTPKYGAQYDRLRRHAGYASEWLRGLRTAFGTGREEVTSALMRVRALEQESDEHFRESIGAIERQREFPNANREDAYRIFVELEELLQAIQDLASNALALSVESPPPRAMQLIDVLLSANASFETMMDESSNGRRPTKSLLRISSLREQARQLHQEGLAEVANSANPLELASSKHVYDSLVDVLKAQYRAALAVEDAVMKHGHRYTAG